MAYSISPYLTFDGNAREVIEFYRSVFGGELTLSTFADFGMPVPPEEAGLVMHSQLDVPGGPTIMASDAPSFMGRPQRGDSISLALFGDAADADRLRGWFDALAEGGTVTQPLEAAPWGDTYGALTDRYGTAWMVDIAAT
jgi:PhnB protein